jgi:hypothetical protein
VKREFIYEIVLYKVLYNQIDITELVKVKELNIMKDPGGAIFNDPGTGSYIKKSPLN